MSNYKDIVGTAVRNNAGNIPSPETGQIFYDSTNLDFKYQFPNLSVGSWRTANGLNTGRRYIGGLGLQTAALAFNGHNGSAVTNLNEQYDGTSWTEIADLNTSQEQSRGVGTTTAGLAYGGYPASGNTESWNGSAWTEVNNLNTARANMASAGDATSALSIGGYSTTVVAIVEQWDGTSWTETTD